MEIPFSQSFCSSRSLSYLRVGPTTTTSAASVGSSRLSVAFFTLPFTKLCQPASLPARFGQDVCSQPLFTLSSHEIYRSLISSQVIKFHANLFLRASFLPLRARVEMSTGKRPDSTKASRLKDVLRKRSLDLSKKTHSSGVESQSSSHHVSEQSYGEELDLNYDQAIGQIMSAQANFMRVIVQQPGPRGKGSVAGETSSAKVIEKAEGIVQPNFKRENFSCKNVNPSQAGLQHNNDVSGAVAGGAIPDVKKNVAQVLSIHCNPELSDTDEGKVGLELLCVVRALLKKIHKKVMVGDKVLVSGIDWIGGRGMIEEVLDRETEILDPPVANVSHLLVLFSMDRPRIEPISLSRFLVEAESTGIPFTLTLNKSDLGSPEEIAKWEDKLLLWGYKPVFCSVNTKFGITPLVSILSNMTSVVIGPSGVGKSSLINALRDQSGIKSWSNLTMEGCECESSRLDAEVVQPWGDGYDEQMVGDVSERSGRGKHTTRNVTLLRLPSGGFLADTPGFNQPGLLKVTPESLPNLFPEVRSRLSKSIRCAFSDCLHIGEPDCVVGGDWERYAHYLQLLEELKKREQISLKTFGTKRESEIRYKVAALGVKKPEPRLVLKKYRRISRQKGKQQLATELSEEVETLE